MSFVFLGYICVARLKLLHNLHAYSCTRAFLSILMEYHGKYHTGIGVGTQYRRVICLLTYNLVMFSTLTLNYFICVLYILFALDL